MATTTKKLNRPSSWQKQVNPNTKKMKALMRDVRGNVVRLTRNSKDLDEWMEKLAPYTASNCFVTGAHADQVRDMVNQIAGVVDQTSLPSGANAEIVKGTMAEACMTMVTNVGEDIKSELQRIAVESYNARNTPQQTAKLIGDKIDSLSRTRCQAIARTETCRAANIANYLNAKEMGAKSYSVLCNEGACEYCLDVYGEDGETVFDIEDTDDLPPYHPNCRCTPVWSMDPVESEEGSDETSTENDDTEFENNPDDFLQGTPVMSEITDAWTGKVMDVYEFENIKVAFARGETALTLEEVSAHLNSLPPIFRETNAKIIKIYDFEHPTDAGSYTRLGSELKLYKSRGYTKSEILDTFTHELSHSLDAQKIGYKYSLKEKYEKIFKADNKLYRVLNERTGRYRTPKKFPTEYAGRSWKKFKNSADKKHLLFVEDFAESTKEYLNPLRHEEFCKKFPNRAKYMEEIYGKPVWDKNSPLYQALEKEGDVKKQRQEQREKYLEQRKQAREYDKQQTKKFEELSENELDKHLREVLSSDTHVKAYYGMKKELQVIKAIEETVMMNDPTPLMKQGYSKDKAMKVLENPNHYLNKNREKKRKYQAVLDEVEKLVKQRL